MIVLRIRHARPNRIIHEANWIVSSFDVWHIFPNGRRPLSSICRKGFRMKDDPKSTNFSNTDIYIYIYYIILYNQLTQLYIRTRFLHGAGSFFGCCAVTPAVCIRRIRLPAYWEAPGTRLAKHITGTSQHRCCATGAFLSYASAPWQRSNSIPHPEKLLASSYCNAIYRQRVWVCEASKKTLQVKTKHYYQIDTQ